MVSNKETPSQAGARKEASVGGKRPAGNSGSMGNAPVEGAPAKPATGSSDPGSAASVYGQPVAELRVLFPDSASIVTSESTGSFNRLYYCKGPTGTQWSETMGFDLGDGWGRAIAGLKVMRADLGNEGLVITFTGGYQALVPLAIMKPSWKTLQ